MIATLWNGNERLDGQLTLGSEGLNFEVDDFHTSALQLSINYNQIQQVRYYKLYEIDNSGVEVMHDELRKSIFILERPQELMIGLLSRLGKKQ